MVRRWFPIVLLSSLLLRGASACAGGPDEQLNPQPLPPNDPDKESTTDDDPTGSSSGDGRGSAAPMPADQSADASADDAPNESGRDP